MRLIFILSSILLLSFTSCKKKVTEVNTDYIGHWEGEDSDGYYTLSIEEDSHAEYYKWNGIAELNINGKAKIKNDKLKILTKKFTITQEPTLVTQLDGTTEYIMILDDIEFYRW